MFIHEMSVDECYSVLQRAKVARLACEHDGQPYTVPINFAFDGEYIYGFTTLGQKVEWMRANPLVCVEVDDIISDNRWLSIVVYGEYEELPDQPEYEHARTRAHAFLQKRALWWEPAALSQDHRDQPHSLIPIVYRIHIKKITGHLATPAKSPPGQDGESFALGWEKNHRTRA